MWKVVTAGCAQICTRLKTKRTFQCQCSTLLGITAKHSCKSLLYNKHVCTSCRTAPVHNMFVRFLAIANTLFVCSPKTKKSKHAANMWMQDLSTRLGCALTMNENHSLNTHENWHGKTGWESTKPPANFVQLISHLPQKSSKPLQIKLTWFSWTTLFHKGRDWIGIAIMSTTSLPQVCQNQCDFHCSTLQELARRRTLSRMSNGWAMAEAEQWCTCSVTLRSTGT